MGINQCSKGTVLWKATGLSLQSLKSLGNRIDVDGNFLFHQLQGSGGKPVEAVIGEMSLFLRQIAHSGGFIVTILLWMEILGLTVNELRGDERKMSGLPKSIECIVGSKSWS